RATAVMSATEIPRTLAESFTDRPSRSLTSRTPSPDPLHRPRPRRLARPAATPIARKPNFFMTPGPFFGPPETRPARTPGLTAQPTPPAAVRPLTYRSASRAERPGHPRGGFFQHAGSAELTLIADY